MTVSDWDARRLAEVEDRRAGARMVAPMEDFVAFPEGVPEGAVRCESCAVSFVPVSGARFCSERCRVVEREVRSLSRKVRGDERSPGDVEAARALVAERKARGEASEEVVRAALVAADWVVERPRLVRSRNVRAPAFWPWDWSVHAGGGVTCRVEVRTADAKRSREGELVPVGPDVVRSKWRKGQFDVLAVVSRDGSVSWFPSGGVPGWFAGERFDGWRPSHRGKVTAEFGTEARRRGR